MPKIINLMKNVNLNKISQLIKISLKYLNFKFEFKFILINSYILHVINSSFQFLSNFFFIIISSLFHLFFLFLLKLITP